MGSDIAEIAPSATPLRPALPRRLPLNCFAKHFDYLA
jgi:hypothetical protein